mmetsp:Transcript_33465/g.53302  ORF Transcript_33465/g.53302 Transcript_33465/m.53302 type:complete len:209 (-) Transcript_33465:3-629(-)
MPCFIRDGSKSFNNYCSDDSPNSGDSEKCYNLELANRTEYKHRDRRNCPSYDDPHTRVQCVRQNFLEKLASKNQEQCRNAKERGVLENLGARLPTRTKSRHADFGIGSVHSRTLIVTTSYEELSSVVRRKGTPDNEDETNPTTLSQHVSQLQNAHACHLAHHSHGRCQHSSSTSFEIICQMLKILIASFFCHWHNLHKGLDHFERLTA